MKKYRLVPFGIAWWVVNIGKAVTAVGFMLMVMVLTFLLA